MPPADSVRLPPVDTGPHEFRLLPTGRSPAQPAAGATRAVRHVLMTADAVGGVWRYSLDLGRAMARRGIRTTLAVMGPSPSRAQRREAARAGVALADQPYFLEWMEDPWEDIRRAGQWLLKLERAFVPDVVHLNGYAHAALPWSAPVLIVAHSCVRSWWRAVKQAEAPARLDRYRAAVAAGLAAARVVVAPTAAMLDAVGAEYGVPIRGCVIPNGCAGGVEAGPPDEKEPLVLAAGRVWDEGKNLAALCAVADRLRWPVALAGDAQEPGAVAGADACRVPGVRWLGRLETDEMYAWYRRAAIYALPARYEPFGLSVLEAAHAGCALVLGDIPSLRENWDGAAAFVPPDDRAALAAAIDGLSADPDARRALADRAFARAAAFTIDRTADDYRHLYEDLAG